MPAIITHYLFGKEVRAQNSIVALCPGLFNWGTQGPDVFFFTPPFGKEARRISRLGEDMHAGKIEQNLIYMAESCRKAIGVEQNALRSYLDGYLAHYILDKTMHPFVYGMQRHFKTHLPEASDSFLHRTIETNLDVLFLARLMNQTVKSFRIVYKLKLKPELDYVCQMYSGLFYQNYGVGLRREQLRKSFVGMRSFYSLLYSPVGIKKGALATVERMLGNHYPEYASLVPTTKASTEIDFANLQKAISEEGNKALNSDAFALFEEAKRSYKQAYDCLNGFLQGEGTLREVTGGLNFEGKPEIN